MSSDTWRTARLAGYSTVSTALALLSDRQLGELMDSAPVISSGVGGTAVLLDIEGMPVFAKRVPVTDREMQPEHARSTANIFGVPAFCQYGLRSGAGFNAWRELAANVMTTNWVLSGRSESFALMYHSRELPGRAAQTLTRAEHADAVEFWHGSSTVADRLDARSASRAGIVLFLEYLPQTLHDWLTTQLAAGDEAIGAAAELVERRLLADVAFMNDNGLLHFDAHFANILTDGQCLYYADLGLASSPRFDLDQQERDFLAINAGHDRWYTITHLVNWLVRELIKPAGFAERNQLIRRYAEGAEPVGVPAPVAGIIKRYAPIVVVMNDFYWTLHGETRLVPYPIKEIEKACADAGIN